MMQYCLSVNNFCQVTNAILSQSMPVDIVITNTIVIKFGYFQIFTFDLLFHLHIYPFDLQESVGGPILLT